MDILFPLRVGPVPCEPYLPLVTPSLITGVIQVRHNSSGFTLAATPVDVARSFMSRGIDHPHIWGALGGGVADMFCSGCLSPLNNEVEANGLGRLTNGLYSGGA
jgi:hypothetical protein